ncbi:MAG: SAM-dependent methyltransferase [Lachnospiraceae bacterium]|nr:SAM-dependent methyltransferase [Lachnospiraceae bacterium]
MTNDRIPVLSERMSLVAEMVTRGNKCADIGCDHGYVAIWLCKTGRSPHVIAADVRKGPLKSAEENAIAFGCGENVECRLGDGLTVLERNEAESIIIAGMGGRTMISILDGSPGIRDAASELILEPQSEIKEVRRYLCANGFEITDEALVREENKYYPVIKAVRSVKADVLSEEEYCFGPCLIRNKDPLLKEMIMKRRKELYSIRNELANGKDGSALKRLREVEDELMMTGRVLENYE